MQFYDRYSKLCVDRGIEPCSQAAADMFGISKSTISSWKTKNTFPKGDTVAAIADALGVSADYLLGRTDSVSDDRSEKFNVLHKLMEEIPEERRGEVKRFLEFTIEQHKKKEG